MAGAALLLCLLGVGCSDEGGGPDAGGGGFIEVVVESEYSRALPIEAALAEVELTQAGETFLRKKADGESLVEG